MNYWLHRISAGAPVAYPLLDKGFLTIGFTNFSDNPEFIDKVLAEKGREYLKQECAKHHSWMSGRRQNMLFNFLVRMKHGDIIIVPIIEGSFAVCEILEDKPMFIPDVYSEDLRAWGNKKVSCNGRILLSEDNICYDLNFAKKVRVLYRNIPRKFAYAALTSRMKYRGTNVCINDLKENIEQSIKNFEEKKPIHLYSSIIDPMAKIVLDTIMNDLKDHQFEKLVQLYFETTGANKISIPSKNEKDKEGDADIVAIFEDIKLIIYVQAKHHQGTTGSWGVNQILDYTIDKKESMDDGYNKIAWLVSTADSFDEEAKNIAMQNNIQLIGGTEFATMLLNAGINLLNTDL